MTSRHDLNGQHVMNPQPGDYWEERFIPVVTVLAVDDDTVTMVYHPGKQGAPINEEAVKISRERFQKTLLYGFSKPDDLKTHCDVHPGHAAVEVVKWVSSGSPHTDRTVRQPLTYFRKLTDYVYMVSSPDAVRAAHQDLSVVGGVLDETFSFETYPCLVVFDDRGNVENIDLNALAKLTDYTNTRIRLYEKDAL